MTDMEEILLKLRAYLSSITPVGTNTKHAGMNTAFQFITTNELDKIDEGVPTKTLDRNFYYESFGMTTFTHAFGTKTDAQCTMQLQLSIWHQRGGSLIESTSRRAKDIQQIISKSVWWPFDVADDNHVDGVKRVDFVDMDDEIVGNHWKSNLTFEVEFVTLSKYVG